MQTKVESNLKEMIGGLGKLQEELKGVNSPFEQFLVNLGQQITSQLKQSLRNEGIDQNSLLSQSIAPEIISDENGVTLKITANNYWKFVNDGVNGVLRNVSGKYNFKTPFPNRKMAASIQDYMGRRGISDAANFKSVSYAIATKVKKYGIEPTHFVDKVMTDEFINTISTQLADEFEKQITIKLTN